MQHILIDKINIIKNPEVLDEIKLIINYKINVIQNMLLSESHVKKYKNISVDWFTI